MYLLAGRDNKGGAGCGHQGLFFSSKRTMSKIHESFVDFDGWIMRFPVKSSERESCEQGA